MNGFKKVAYFYKNYFYFFRKFVKARLNFFEMKVYLNLFSQNPLLSNTFGLSKTKLIKFKLLMTSAVFRNKDLITMFDCNDKTQVIFKN